MIPEFPTFKHLELSDREEIESITRQLPPYSDFHFLCMWIWDIHEPACISKHNNNLVTKQADFLTGKTFYSIIGTNSISATIDKVHSFNLKNGCSLTLKWIPEETIKYVNGFSARILEDRDNHDYVFDVAKIFYAKGNGFRHYRNDINIFQKNYSQTILRPMDLNDCIVKTKINNLFLIWNENIKTEYKVGNLIFEHKALNKLLSSANEFKSILSLGLFDKDDLIAFSISDIINRDFAICPFLIANKDFEGSFQFLMKKMIELLFGKGVKFLNCEADYGISTWRNYKMSYRPTFFLKKYTIESCN